jgi:hypothetical protein
MSSLFLPNSMRNEARAVPEWFATALRDIDPSLIVYFNHIRQRWILDRCTAAGEHHVANHQHTPECPRTNVKVIQGEGGEYMPLCADVLDWLRAHDTWSQHSSGDQMVQILANQHADHLEKLKQARRANTRHATLDGKRQLYRMKFLIDQHDLKVNQ